MPLREPQRIAVLDVETLPADTASRAWREVAERHMAEPYPGPPANYRDPQKIAEHRAAWSAGRAEALAERLAASSLEPHLARIACIGLLIVDDVAQLDTAEPADVDALEGPDVLRDLAERLRNVGVVVAHNAAFDMPLLACAYLRAGAGVPSIIRRAARAAMHRRPERGLVDTADLPAWSSRDRRLPLSLASAAAMLDLPAPTTIRGSEVAAAWERDPAAVLAHVREDVALAARIAGHGHALGWWEVQP